MDHTTSSAAVKLDGLHVPAQRKADHEGLKHKEPEEIIKVFRVRERTLFIQLEISAL